MRKIAFLIVTFALIFLLPLIGSLVRWQGLPPGYGLFPSQKVIEPPGFSVSFFVFGCAVALFLSIFILFPRWFGFKKLQSISEPKKSSKTKFPIWFWISIPILILCWLTMWSQIPFLKFFEAYTFVPLWWSFICILDGMVYKRNHGFSLLSQKPRLLQLLAIVSCFSWFAFEYLNYFVVENWYYPNKDVFSNFGNVFWFSLSYTTVLPAIVEWYLLLKTFPNIKERYSKGPKIILNKPIMVTLYILGLILAVAMGYFPHQLFFVLWLALVPMLSAAMGLVGLWNPFTSIKKGDWTSIVLIAVATVFNGFFWELWNYGIEKFNNGSPTNPNYWKYSVPYLDKFHLFSEMPFLGYFGYLFFGVNCWIIWLTAAYVFKFDPNFELSSKEKTISDKISA
ncbi:small-conductance mechanosensitive channel [Paenibacillus sp. WLX1005]|uniref:small-conductance mechanosensitive channel n=1 Tax=Paenibacillus sp. WLX1005 TaxID=3243766 RepID=UPI0039842132